MREQVALIQNQAMPEARKQELLSLSFVLASREIAREILLRVIKEVFTMKTLPTIVEDMFGDALRERELQTERRGEAVGALKDARTILLRIYTKRLGAPSSEVVARLEAIDNIEALHSMIDRYDEQVESWEQLLPPVNAD